MFTGWWLDLAALRDAGASALSRAAAAEEDLRPSGRRCLQPQRDKQMLSSTSGTKSFAYFYWKKFQQWTWWLFKWKTLWCPHRDVTWRSLQLVAEWERYTNPFLCSTNSDVAFSPWDVTPHQWYRGSSWKVWTFTAEKHLKISGF